MGRLHILVLAIVAVISTQAAGEEFGSTKEYVSLKPYYDCLGMMEFNSLITGDTCDLIKEGIDIKRKEIAMMAGLCREADTTYYSDGRPIYAVNGGMAYSDNGVVYECKTGRIKTLGYSPFQ